MTGTKFSWTSAIYSSIPSDTPTLHTETTYSTSRDAPSSTQHSSSSGPVVVLLWWCTRPCQNFLPALLHHHSPSTILHTSLTYVYLPTNTTRYIYSPLLLCEPRKMAQLNWTCVPGWSFGWVVACLGGQLVGVHPLMLYERTVTHRCIDIFYGVR